MYCEFQSSRLHIYCQLIISIMLNIAKSRSYSLLHHSIFNVTTIAVFSGSSRRDLLTQKVIKGLKKSFNQPLQFIGVGGDLVKPLLKTQYANSNELDKNPIEVHRYFEENAQGSILVPYRTIALYKNKRLLNKLIKQKLFDDLISNQVSAIINVGNYFLTKELNQKIRNHYEGLGKIAPPSFLYDAVHFNRRVENEGFLDHQFYHIPRRVDNFADYQFPSTLIGYDGVFQVYRHLQQFNNGKELLKQNFSQEIFQLLRKSRKQYRETQKIHEDNFVMLLAPGNQSHEVDFSFNSFATAINKFRKNDKIKNIDSKLFTVLVLLPENLAISNQIKQRITRIKQVRVILVEPKDKQAALSSADVAFLHNGQITVQAAAAQLPAIIGDSMSFMHAYYSMWVNLYQSPLNISVQKQGYVQLLSASAAIPQKVSDLLLQHFQNPKLKFFYIKTYQKALMQILSIGKLNPTWSLEKTGLDVSYAKIKQTIGKYSKLDKNSYKNQWGLRKQLLS